MNNRGLFSGESLVLEKLPAYFLFAAIIWFGLKLLDVVNPFLDTLIFSAVVATLTFPIYAKFEAWFKGRKRLASLVTCLIVVFVIVIPLLFFLLILIGQAMDMYNTVNNYLQKFDLNTLLTMLKWQPGNFFYDLSGPYSKDIANLVQQNMDGLKTILSDSAKFISTFAAKQSAKLLADLVLTVLHLILMFFTLYFLYKDGRHILRRLMVLSPIPQKHEEVLFQKYQEVSKAALFGTFMTAIAQGIVAWIGFSIAGIPSAFFWGTAVSLFSLVPSIGTGMVWLPMGLILVLSGNIFWGIFIWIWGATLVATVDNVLRVIFIGSTAKINPLLTFVTVFGGILAFGLIGIIYGPMVLVIFFTLLHVYELEYGDKLKTHPVEGLEEPKFESRKS
jgi:predicted PurR-regulated permease PerM